MKTRRVIVTTVLLCILWSVAGSQSGVSPISDETTPLSDRLGAIKMAALNKDVEAVDSLIDALGSSQQEVSQEAGKALIRIGQPAYQKVCKALRLHQNTGVRKKCAALCVELSGAAAKADLLATMLADSDNDVRAACVTALASLNDPLVTSPLLVALKDKSNAVREAVIRALKNTGSAGQYENMFLEACQDPDSTVRQAAIEALGSLDSAKARSALVRLVIGDNDSSVRKSAENEITRIGDKTFSAALAAEPAYGDLCLLAAIDGAIGESARSEIVKAGPSASAEIRKVLAGAEFPAARKAAVQLLAAVEQKNALSDFQAALLRDKDGGVRAAAIEEIGKLRSSESIQALSLALDDSDGAVRAAAIRVIGDLGAGPEYAERITGYAADDNYTVRGAVIDFLEKSKESTVFRTLLIRANKETDYTLKQKIQKILSSPDSESIVRGLAASGLYDDLCMAAVLEGSLGESARRSLVTAGSAAVPALAKALDANDTEAVRKEAARLLTEIEGAKANPRLHAAILKDKAPEVRAICIDLAAKSGKEPDLYVILNALSDESDTVRAAVIRAIVSMGAGSKELPRLIGALKEDKSGTVRSQAAELLGTLAEPEGARALVEQLLTESDNTTLSTIKDALGKMGTQRLVDEFRGRKDAASLVNAVAGESDIAIPAEAALAEMGEEGVEAAIRMLHDAPVPKTRNKSADLLVKWKGAAALPDVGKAAQADKDKDVRLKCVSLLASMDDRGVVPYLEGLTEDPESSVCAAAIQAIHSKGLSKEKIEVLIGATRRQTSTGDATAALGKIFAELRDVRTVEPMVKTLGDAPEPQYLRALGMIGDPSAIPALVKTMDKGGALGILSRVSLCSIGNNCIRAGDFDSALAAFTKVLAAQNNYYAAYVGRGVAKMRTGDLKGAAEDFEAAGKLPVKNRSSLEINLGTLAVAQKDLEKARGHFKKALENDRASAAAWYNLGWVEDELGNAPEAQQALALAGALDQTHARAPLALGIVYAKLRNFGEAQSNFYEALRRSRPGSMEARLTVYNLAKMRGAATVIDGSDRDAFLRAAAMASVGNWKGVGAEVPSLPETKQIPIEVMWLKAYAAATQGDSDRILESHKSLTEKTVSIAAEEGVEVYVEGVNLIPGQEIPLIPSVYYIVVRRSGEAKPRYKGYVTIPVAGEPEKIEGVRWNVGIQGK